MASGAVSAAGRGRCINWKVGTPSSLLFACEMSISYSGAGAVALGDDEELAVRVIRVERGADGVVALLRHGPQVHGPARITDPADELVSGARPPAGAQGPRAPPERPRAERLLGPAGERPREIDPAAVGRATHPTHRLGGPVGAAPLEQAVQPVVRAATR